MSLSVVIKDRISFGNLKLRILEINNIEDTGSTYNTGLTTVHAVKALNNTDTSDTFKEAVGAASSSTTKGQVTFTAVTSTDDGVAWIWGR